MYRMLDKYIDFENDIVLRKPGNAGGRTRIAIREASDHPGGGAGGYVQNARLMCAGEHGPVLWVG